MTDYDALARAILQHNRRHRRGRGRTKSTMIWPPRARSASRGAFERVSAREPCAVCGHDSLCLVSRDGGTVLCGRIQSDRPRPNALGDLWVHMRGAPRGPRIARTPPPPRPISERASAAHRDAFYRALLGHLRLWDMDLAALQRRGLSEQAITRGLYRTLPAGGREELARAMAHLDPSPLGVPSVPGLVRTDRVRVVGPPGLLIPVCDPEGRIVAIKIRLRTDDGPRYVSLSSRFHGGASAEAALHVPVRAKSLLDAGADVLIVTEGELKADVITELSGTPCVSVPGVGAWRLALAAVDRWATPGGVILAFDMDRFTSPAVDKAHRALCEALLARDRRVRSARWDRRHKGLDDHLAARARGEISDARSPGVDTP